MGNSGYLSPEHETNSPNFSPNRGPRKSRLSSAPKPRSEPHILSPKACSLTSENPLLSLNKSCTLQPSRKIEEDVDIVYDSKDEEAYHRCRLLRQVYLGLLADT